MIGDRSDTETWQLVERRRERIIGVDCGNVYIPGGEACKFSLICRRIDKYMRRCHDEVFGTDWTEQFANKSLELGLPMF